MRSSFERIRHSTEGMSQQIDAVSSATKDLTEHADMLLQEVNKFKI